MNPEPIVTRRRTWFIASAGTIAAVTLAGAIAGFAWLPMQQPHTGFSGVWQAICSAAGLVRVAPAAGQIMQAAYPTTQVEITPQMLRGASAESIGSGATLALRCTICHGVRGMSRADAPNLAGQYAIAIYKQLRDFQTGARLSAVMAPLVSSLTDADLRDLAAYYAYLPRVAGGLGSTNGPPAIVASGAPMRGIAPCGACHGGLASKAGAAWLDGQPIAYLGAQLRAFASGIRRNDIDAQMRNVAHAMTPAEIVAASRYYAE